MLLTPSQILALCLKPAYALDLDAGRALERRHQLHLDGTPALLRQFLELSRPDMLASPDVFATLLKVMKPATKPLYAGLTNILGKVFTAAGASYYYDFTDSALADDFADYLADTTRSGQDFYGQFRTVWGKASLTGFQGVLLVDLAATPVNESNDDGLAGVTGVPLGMPAPVFSFVPSVTIHDVSLTGNRVEYLLLTATEADKSTSYYCWDDQYCHRVFTVNGTPTYALDRRTTHGLGYVPACPVTTRQSDPTRPVRRTSALADSLEVADVYLRDFNEHELGKTYHAFPKMWSYGVKCEYQAPLTDGNGFEGAQTCNAGRLAYGLNASGYSGSYDCPKCHGQGRYIPVGPDKTYILAVPQQGDPSIVPPAGYIVPDLSSLEYLGNELKVNAAAIEKAVIGKEGITTMHTKVESGAAKELDMAPIYDALNDYGDDALTAMKFVVDTFGRLRYADAFRASAMALGKRYHLKSTDQLEAEYKGAKEAGLDSALLYGYLEDITYTKYAADPLELERALLKLELTPVPHLTDQEAANLGIIGEDDLLLKAYLNDFVARFERDNGSILEFGCLLSHGAKIDKILTIFNTYLDGKRKAKPAGLIPGTLTVNPESGAGVGGLPQPGLSPERPGGGSNGAAGSAAAVHANPGNSAVA